jgi:catechol 2,3-dioxygenase-like lactoylglutathione lyase family enzyme
MIDHIGINCADLEASKSFYDTVLAPLGYERIMDFGVACGYGKPGDPAFWLSIYDDMPEAQREVHIAFQAADEAAVRAFHEAAVGAGAESLHEPRLWPEYHAGYFGAFVRDPDGNNVEAVVHLPAPAE